MIQSVESVGAVYRSNRIGVYPTGAKASFQTRYSGRVEVPTTRVRPLVRCYWNRESD